MQSPLPTSHALSRLPVLGTPATHQVGIVVRDLEAAARRYNHLWDVGPWRVFTYSPTILSSQHYRGRPAAYSMKLALNLQQPQIELIQPLQGPTIYHDWLQIRPEGGIHHLAITVGSLDETVATMAEAGFPAIQDGRGFGVHGDGGFAYFDTEHTLGFVIEAIELPSERREPEAVLA